MVAIVTTHFTNENLNHLSKPFTELEIKEALFDMEPYKALGLDGLHAFFFFLEELENS